MKQQIRKKLFPKAAAGMFVWAVVLAGTIELLLAGPGGHAANPEIKIWRQVRIPPQEHSWRDPNVQLVNGHDQNLQEGPVGDIQVGLLGAVPRPGMYLLRKDECTLRALLKAAGGVGKSANGKLGLIQFVDRTTRPRVVRVDLYNRYRQSYLLRFSLYDGDVVLVEGRADRCYMVNLPHWVAEARCSTRDGRSIGSLLKGDLPFNQPAGAWLIRQNSTGQRIHLKGDALASDHGSSSGASLRPGDLLYMERPAVDNPIRVVNIVGITPTHLR